MNEIHSVTEPNLADDPIVEDKRAAVEFPEKGDRPSDTSPPQDLGIPAILKLCELHNRREPRKNPRKRFKQAPMDSLVESIRAKGVNQPILVRPREEGGYEIVAGERRVRASREVFGPDGLIPAYIRECSEDEADALALIENLEREDMTEVEEAEAAYDILMRVKGDHEEGARRLAWTVSKFKRRVALMKATEAVRKALDNEQIELGHAELLAAHVPLDKQQAALETILKLKLTVVQLKGKLGQLAKRLDTAIFDREECRTCSFNSEQQIAMFSETLQAGYCTNGACYSAKTESRVTEIADKLKDETPRVVILRDDSDIIPIKLAADGKFGVGPEQLAACRACADFGCTVSAVTGSMGDVERDICFNAGCNTKKVAAHVQAVKASAKADPLPARSKAQQPGITATQQKRPARTDITVTTPQPVKDYRLKQWRTIAGNAAFKNPDMALRLLVALGLSGLTRDIDDSKVQTAYSKLTGRADRWQHSLGEAAQAVADLPLESLQRLTHAMGASAMNKLEERHVCAAMAFMQIRMSEHWRLNAEFLGLLSKPEIEAVATELGIASMLGEKAMKKLMAEKKDAFIKALLGVEGFDYSQAVPKAMEYDSRKRDGALPNPDAAQHEGMGGTECDSPETADEAA